MTYEELLKHCRICKRFAEANNIPLDHESTKIGVCVTYEEMAEILESGELVVQMPFIRNVNPAKKQVVEGVTVMPTSILIGRKRYILKHNDQYLLLSDINIPSKD